MNVYGIETFLIGMVGGGVNLALFIYLRNRALNPHKTPASPQFRQSAPTIEGTASKSINRRRKIESKPTIICSLPIHQVTRPQARLS
ncbi:MAG TPA: hypothetical protein VIL74_08285 [Pyrinomonadaceae bacterium]|jgi:hypothetical protein